MSYFLSQRAEQDLDDIWLHSAETWSWPQADRYLTTILERLDDLGRGHTRGRVVDFLDDVRRLNVASHAIYYRDGDGGVLVLRILHQSMDPSSNIEPA